MSKVHVYFMPGLAASSTIFERIRLPEDQFESHFLEWLVPVANETLSDYAKRLTEKVTEPNPVLIGVSFGGIVVQEMAQFVNPMRIIIISSVKSNLEFPRRMKMARFTHLYKLFPTKFMQDMDRFNRLPLGKMFRDRMKLYEKFMAMRNKEYLDWAFKNILEWKCKEPISGIVHIHGDQDLVFPPRCIKNFIAVPGGTHVMILFKAGWFNKHLPEIITNGKL